MEEENRKARRAVRREYMENVRELVAFVKKRDKRVARFQVGQGGAAK
jgi:DnaJ family protein A protein 5